MTAKWFVSRQSYWGVDPEDQNVVEIAAGGVDYANADMLCERWPKLGEGEEFTDPRKALQAARAILEAWNVADPEAGARIETGYTGGYGMPFLSAPSDEELDAWAAAEWNALPKCDMCGEAYGQGEGWHLVDDPDYGTYCSEYCCDKAAADYYGNDEDEDED